MSFRPLHPVQAAARASDIGAAGRTDVPVQLVREDADRALVLRVRAGDEGAFDAIFREYYGPLCSFADRYLQTGDEAAEVVQDVFARLWRNRAEWRVEGSIRAYLHGAVRNGAWNVLRHRRIAERYRAPWADAKDVPAAERERSGDEDTFDRDDVAHVLRCALQLPDRCRQVFFLRWEQGLTYAEIARVMDISAKTVDNHMQRALVLLRVLASR